MSVNIEHDLRYKVSRDIVDSMIELRATGMSYQKIANMFRVSYHTAYYWCNDDFRKHKRSCNAKRTYPRGDVRIKHLVKRRKELIDMGNEGVRILKNISGAKYDKHCKRKTICGISIADYEKKFEKFKNGGRKID